MGSHPRRVASGFAAALVVLGLAVGPVAADTFPSGDFAFSEAGLSADAFTNDCVDNTDGTTTCTGSAIFLFAGKTHELGTGTQRGTELCLTVFTETFDTATGDPIDFVEEFGCTKDVAAGSVIARDLSAATITPTTVTIQGATCDETGCVPSGDPRDVVVEGTWTPTSPVVRDSFRSRFDDGICVSRNSSSGYSREATFSGVVDGQTVQTTAASLRNGKFSFSQKCAI